MALKHKSEVDMIQGPEFINLQPLDVNPLMSECEIKVLYLGHNRNGSYVNRETAESMAKTLRGTPIVAAWNEDKQDFGTHGHVMTIEDGEISFSCKTVPYGFVSPDAKVWFSNFTDTDEFGNKVERTYLMTTGYLWTGQFPELTKVIEEGQPHSMELDSESLDGHWATDNNLGIDFFIINDATFSKLCILGDDVEPCFEGSSVTSPQVSKNFAKTSDFQKTLFTMMNDLQMALQSEGGLNVPTDENKDFTETVDEVVEEETAEETVEDEVFEAESEQEEAADEFTDEPDAADEAVEDSANEDSTEDFAAETDDKDDVDAANGLGGDPVHTEEEFTALNEEIQSLRAEIEELRAFKLSAENEKKDALINSYHMLSDEDKADVIAHKEEYSLDEIKSKLAVIYVEKNVNFDTVDGQEEVEEDNSSVMTYSLDDTNETAEVAPQYVELLRAISKRN